MMIFLRKIKITSDVTNAQNQGQLIDRSDSRDPNTIVGCFFFQTLLYSFYKMIFSRVCNELEAADLILVIIY